MLAVPSLLAFHAVPQLYASLAGGVIAYLSIMQTIVLSPGREKIYLRVSSIRSYLTRLKVFQLDRGQIPGTLWQENRLAMERIYSHAGRHWRQLERELAKDRFGLRPGCYVFGLIAFALLLISAVTSALEPTSRSRVLESVAFYSAVGVFARLLVYHISALGAINKLYPPLGRGKILILGIDEKNYRNRHAVYEVPKDAKELRVKVLFKGRLTNGFFDSLLNLKDNASFFYPDALTYFNDFGFKQTGVHGNPQLVIGVFDTGVIQGVTAEEGLELTLGFQVRAGGQYSSRYGTATLCSDVSTIEIGVYEDPAYTLTQRARAPTYFEEVRLLVASATVELTYP